MNILDSLYEERTWQGFLQYKIEKQHLSGKEQKQLEDYIHEKTYYPLLKEMEQEKYEFPIPMKKEITRVEHQKNGLYTLILMILIRFSKSLHFPCISMMEYFQIIVMHFAAILE